MSKFGPLVSPKWLHDHIGEPDLRVVDFRWYLVGRQGRDAYLGGHIPGAVFVDLDAVTGTGAGRHPLPTRQKFQDEMRLAGVSTGTRVVAYDDAGGSIAARLWFLLGWFGHGAQAVLDSGLQGWGEPLETAVPFVKAGDFKARAPTFSSMRGRVSAIEERKSRSIRRRATSRAPSALHGSTTSTRTHGSSRPTSCGASTGPWVSMGRKARSSIAGQASTPAMTCSRWSLQALPTCAFTRDRGATGRIVTPLSPRANNHGDWLRIRP